MSVHLTATQLQSEQKSCASHCYALRQNSSIHDNLTVYNFLQTIVSCENKFFSTNILVPQFYLLCFSCAEVMCLTAVNMQHTSSNVLKKFATQLLCQQNTRSNYNNCAVLRYHRTLSMCPESYTLSCHHLSG